MKALFLVALIISIIILLILLIYKISVGSTQKAYKAYNKDWMKLDLRHVEHEQIRWLIKQLEKAYIPTKTELKAGATFAKLVAPKKIEIEVFVPLEDYTRAEELIKEWLAKK